MEIPIEIKMAMKNLEPIKYKTFDVAYFVLKDGDDMGNSDYCENCINDAVKEAKDYHLKRRNEIIDKYNQIEKNGFFKIGRKKIQVKGKYSDNKIKKSRMYELKDYRLKSKFSYEGHDPDFGGGLREPHSCENCGEYFTCTFVPSEEEANRILDVVNSEDTIIDIDKWVVYEGLSSYQYVKESNIKKILLEASKKIINK